MLNPVVAGAWTTTEETNIGSIPYCPHPGIRRPTVEPSAEYRGKHASGGKAVQPAQVTMYPMSQRVPKALKFPALSAVANPFDRVEPPASE